MSSDYTQRKDEAFALPPVPYILIMEDASLEEGIEDYGHACAEAARAPLLARIAELGALVEKECAHDAPLPPEYKVEEFLPGIWAWSVKGESEWVGDGAAYGWYEAAVVAAWRDHADTLARALDVSTAAETSAIDERERLRAELAAKGGEVEALREYWSASAEDVAAAVNREMALRAEVEDWRKLLDPANLHVNLLQGKPAKLSRAQLAHLLGWDYTELLAEVEKLHASRAAEGDRLDWLLCRLPGNVLRDLVGDLSDMSDVAEFRRAIDRAAGFWPGAAAQRGERDVPVEMLAALDLDDVAAQSPFAQRQLAALRAEVEALRADAERYRYLRDSDDFETLTVVADYAPTSEWDRRIDAAIAAQRGEGDTTE